MRTQVGIVGAGPAGLLLSHVLHQHGIESIILEDRTREYCENRIRAGVLEHGTVKMINDLGLGERMMREGLIHNGIYFRIYGRDYHFNFPELTGGKYITVYSQHELVKDLIAARLAFGGQILFEAKDVTVHDPETSAPSIRFQHDGKSQKIECDFIAGCDGFHGVCRPSVPAGVLQVFEHVYQFAWLGILAQAAPSCDELIYSRSSRGFALLSMRTPEISRLYLQCRPDEDINEWPDERIWEELQLRVKSNDAWTLKEGPVLQKGVTGMRSFVIEPMQYGRLFLLGDAAHIVPPTGAKGLNLAAGDVHFLGKALEAFYRTGRSDLLDGYSQSCLGRVWKAQRFSWWMTSMLHRFDKEDFLAKLHLADLQFLVTSRGAMQALAENYVGLPFE